MTVHYDYDEEEDDCISTLHGDSLRALCVSRDGCHVASCDVMGGTKVWKISGDGGEIKFELIGILKVHKEQQRMFTDNTDATCGAARACVFSEGIDAFERAYVVIFVGYDDGFVRAWRHIEDRSWAMLLCHQGHTGVVRDLSQYQPLPSVPKSEKLILSCSDDCTAHVWASSEQFPPQLDGKVAEWGWGPVATLLHDEKVMTVCGLSASEEFPARVACSCAQGTVDVWARSKFSPEWSRIQTLEVVSDCRGLAHTYLWHQDKFRAVVLHGNAAEIWDSPSNACEALKSRNVEHLVLRGGGHLRREETLFHATTAVVRSCSIRCDGALIATCDSRGNVKIWGKVQRAGCVQVESADDEHRSMWHCVHSMQANASVWVCAFGNGVLEGWVLYGTECGHLCALDSSRIIPMWASSDTATHNARRQQSAQQSSDEDTRAAYQAVSESPAVGASVSVGDAHSHQPSLIPSVPSVTKKKKPQSALGTEEFRGVSAFEGLYDHWQVILPWEATRKVFPSAYKAANVWDQSIRKTFGIFDILNFPDVETKSPDQSLANTSSQTVTTDKITHKDSVAPAPARESCAKVVDSSGSEFVPSQNGTLNMDAKAEKVNKPSKTKKKKRFYEALMPSDQAWHHVVVRSENVSAQTFQLERMRSRDKLSEWVSPRYIRNASFPASKSDGPPAVQSLVLAAVVSGDVIGLADAEVLSVRPLGEVKEYREAEGTWWQWEYKVLYVHGAACGKEDWLRPELVFPHSSERLALQTLRKSKLRLPSPSVPNPEPQAPAHSPALAITAVEATKSSSLVLLPHPGPPSNLQIQYLAVNTELPARQACAGSMFPHALPPLVSSFGLFSPLSSQPIPVLESFGAPTTSQAIDCNARAAQFAAWHHENKNNQQPGPPRPPTPFASLLQHHLLLTQQHQDTQNTHQVHQTMAPSGGLQGLPRAQYVHGYYNSNGKGEEVKKAAGNEALERDETDLPKKGMPNGDAKGDDEQPESACTVDAINGAIMRAGDNGRKDSSCVHATSSAEDGSAIASDGKHSGNDASGRKHEVESVGKEAMVCVAEEGNARSKVKGSAEKWVEVVTDHSHLLYTREHLPSTMSDAARLSEGLLDNAKKYTFPSRGKKTSIWWPPTAKHVFPNQEAADALAARAHSQGSQKPPLAETSSRLAVHCEGTAAHAHEVLKGTMLIFDGGKQIRIMCEHGTLSPSDFCKAAHNTMRRPGNTIFITDLNMSLNQYLNDVLNMNRKVKDPEKRKTTSQDGGSVADEQEDGFLDKVKKKKKKTGGTEKRKASLQNGGSVADEEDVFIDIVQQKNKKIGGLAKRKASSQDGRSFADEEEDVSMEKVQQKNKKIGGLAKRKASSQDGESVADEEEDVFMEKVQRKKKKLGTLEKRKSSSQDGGSAAEEEEEAFEVGKEKEVLVEEDLEGNGEETETRRDKPKRFYVKVNGQLKLMKVFATCEHCNKPFLYRSSFIRHMRTHGVTIEGVEGGEYKQRDGKENHSEMEECTFDAPMEHQDTDRREQRVRNRMLLKVQKHFKKTGGQAPSISKRLLRERATRLTAKSASLRNRGKDWGTRDLLARARVAKARGKTRASMARRERPVRRVRRETGWNIGDACGWNSDNCADAAAASGSDGEIRPDGGRVLPGEYAGINTDEESSDGEIDESARPFVTHACAAAMRLCDALEPIAFKGNFGGKAWKEEILGCTLLDLGMELRFFESNLRACVMSEFYARDVRERLLEAMQNLESDKAGVHAVHTLASHICPTVFVPATEVQVVGRSANPSSNNHHNKRKSGWEVGGARHRNRLQMLAMKAENDAEKGRGKGSKDGGQWRVRNRQRREREGKFVVEDNSDDEPVLVELDGNSFDKTDPAADQDGSAGMLIDVEDGSISEFIASVSGSEVEGIADPEKLDVPTNEDECMEPQDKVSSERRSTNGIESETQTDSNTKQGDKERLGNLGSSGDGGAQPGGPQSSSADVIPETPPTEERAC